MSEPDELYTLRAQYWLGHYILCLDEAKSIARLPMSPQLKIEREEFVLRSYLAMGEFEKVLQLPTQNEDDPGEFLVLMFVYGMCGIGGMVIVLMSR